MAADKSRSKKDSRLVWEAIKIYLKNEKDKSAKFSSSDLEPLVKGYNMHAIPRLKLGGIIKFVESVYVPGTGYQSLYGISENFLGYRLEDILKFTYRTAKSKASS